MNKVDNLIIILFLSFKIEKIKGILIKNIKDI